MGDKKNQIQQANTIQLVLINSDFILAIITSRSHDGNTNVSDCIN